MYRKILILLLLISPLLFFFVGYPIDSKTPKNFGTAVESSRCYQLGNTKEFLNCFKQHNRRGGISFIQQTITRVNDLQPGMGYLLLVVVISQIILFYKVSMALLQQE